MTLPKISIVTPSFNQGKYLEETMRSVLDQGYPNLQYIVIDGGSTDNSVEIIKKYADRLDYWTSEKDRGQADAINKGIQRCTGDVFGYINSDDLLLPGSLDCVARKWIEGHKWIVGWTTYLEIGGGDWPYPVEPVGRNIDWFIRNPIPQQSSFWAMSYFQQLGMFREDQHYCFDYEFWMRLHFQAKARPSVVRKCLAAFRLHEESKTVSVWDNFIPEFKTIWAQYEKYLSPREKMQLWLERRHEQAGSTRNRGWRALKERDVKTARKEAITAMGEEPLSLESWRMMFCALRGR